MGDRSSRAGSEVVVAADVGGRIFSYTVDVVVFSIAAFVALWLLSFIHGPVLTVRRAGNLVERVNIDEVRLAADTAVVSLLSGLYFAGSWCRWGATVGQRLAGIEVRVAERPVEARGGVPLRRAVIRWLALGAPLWIGASVAGGNLRWALWAAACAWYVLLIGSTARSPGLQGFHDRFARTATVRRVQLIGATPLVEPAPNPNMPVPADA